MRYACVCSGISAPTVAWQPLGWTPVFFAEIEPFPSAVLAHHYPNVPNYGDMTRFKEWPDDAIDLLVGGTPCQSFSVAGLRKGLDDPRGNLALVFLALADRYRPEWVVWENVPGVLSSNGGRDFGAFLGGLGELGYGWAYRCLDAQWFGLAQRRRRVFVVGHLGDWRRAAAVLFEPEGLRGDSAPSREAGQRLADSLTVGANQYSGFCGEPVTSTGEISHCLNAGGMGRIDYETETLIAFSAKDHGADAMSDLSPTLRAGGHDKSHANAGVMPAVAWSIMPQNSSRDYKARAVDVAQPLMAGGPVGGNQGGDFIQQSTAVRRLTPRECERLQGFPDDFTAIPYRGKPAAGGPRYKALGNSMAVPVLAWIGRRIALLQDALQQREAAE